MDAKAHIYRNEHDLADGLKKIRELKVSIWKHVDDKAKEYNTNFINVIELDSMFRTAEVVLIGALNRHETRGAHTMMEYPKRDDIKFLKHTLAYYTNTCDDNYGYPKMEWFPVTFTHYAPVERDTINVNRTPSKKVRKDILYRKSLIGCGWITILLKSAENKIRIYGIAMLF